MPLPEPGPDPHGTLAWINAVIDTMKAAYQALLVPLGIFIAWMVRTILGRRDRAQARADAKEAAEQAAHQKILDQLDEDSAERVRLMKEENAALRLERDELQAVLRQERAENEAVVNRLRATLRRWYDLAHDMRHLAINFLQVSVSVTAHHGLPRPLGTVPELSYDVENP